MTGGGSERHRETQERLTSHAAEGLCTDPSEADGHASTTGEAARKSLLGSLIQLQVEEDGHGGQLQRERADEVTAAGRPTS